MLILRRRLQYGPEEGAKQWSKALSRFLIDRDSSLSGKGADVLDAVGRDSKIPCQTNWDFIWNRRLATFESPANGFSK